MPTTINNPQSRMPSRRPRKPPEASGPLTCTFTRRSPSQSLPVLGRTEDGVDDGPGAVTVYLRDCCTLRLVAFPPVQGTTAATCDSVHQPPVYEALAAEMGTSSNGSRSCRSWLGSPSVDCGAHPPSAMVGYQPRVIPRIPGHRGRAESPAEAASGATQARGTTRHALCQGLRPLTPSHKFRWDD
jgi:hypothetical protein